MTLTSLARKRGRDGAGKGEESYRKHFLISHILLPQVAILSMKLGRGGLIVDMHAGDGEGVETPQQDCFGVDISDGTAAMAVQAAWKWGASVVLCETKPVLRKKLKAHFRGATILTTHNKIPTVIQINTYPWVVVLNDPNGHSRHGLDVLAYISRASRVSDFIICVNEGSLKRHLGVRDNVDDVGHKNGAMLKGCVEKRDQYAWMMDRDEWKVLLRKKHGASARFLCGKGAYKGRVMLFSNFVGNISSGMFEQW